MDKIKPNKKKKMLMAEVGNDTIVLYNRTNGYTKNPTHFEPTTKKKIQSKRKLCLIHKKKCLMIGAHILCINILSGFT